MNRSELRRHLQSELDCSGPEAERCLAAVLEGIATGVRRDGIVQLLGFGTFRSSFRRARTVRDLQGGGRLRLPAGHSVVFRSSRVLRDRSTPALPARGSSFGTRLVGDGSRIF